MPHEIDESNNRDNIAYVNKVPWHSLGQPLTPDQPLDVWCKEAGLNFEYTLAPVHFHVPHPEDPDYFEILETFEGKNVVYRSDTKAPLSVVSDRYQLVQPAQILGFFEDLIAKDQFTLEVAGSLKGGARIWALAKSVEEINLGGVDLIKPYLLLTTSADGSLATTAKHTTVRVVCNNTMEMCINNDEAVIKIHHNQIFDEARVKVDRGLRDIDNFTDQITAMSNRPLKDYEAKSAIIAIFGNPEATLAEQPNERAMKNVLELFNGKAQGSNLPTADNTAWGLLNATTEYIDHHRKARSQSTRLNSAWYGDGAATKRKAFGECLDLAA